MLPDSPAAAGLRTGDVITQFNGRRAANAGELRTVGLTRAGRKVEVGYLRGGKTRKTTVSRHARAGGGNPLPQPAPGRAHGGRIHPMRRSMAVSRA